MPARETIEDRGYFAKRAREEREKAAICEDNAAALAHLKLADAYTRRADGIVAFARAIPS